jgi:hypothetical protein
MASSDYDFQRDQFTFDRLTFEQIPRGRARRAMKIDLSVRGGMVKKCTASANMEAELQFQVERVRA